ncbi:MAG TPA: phage holin family protein [Candidatus Binatia bacterium]|nr:phage holin family protein [Candidatus Binatia bacterium]
MNEPGGALRGARHGITRILITLVIDALALVILSALMDSFQLGSFYQALGVAAALGLLNALAWPLLQKILLPVTVLSLGLVSLIINGVFVVLAINLTGHDIYIKDWGAGVVVALGLTVLNALFTRLLAINDDDFYYRNIIRRQARRQKFRSTDKTDRTGIIFLEIDGLAHEILVRAIRSGSAPNMARWLRDGSHRLTRWECDWSSQTGAMQAGILLGSNWDMPSFRWYEKDKGAAMVSNHAKDAMEIERRHSNGKGLLHYDGASRANLVSGDAPHSMITMSTVLKKDRRGSVGQDYMAFFSNPYSALRTLAMVIGEVFKEIHQQIRQKRRGVVPRVHRGLFPYPLLRAFTNVLQRELGMAATIQDIYAGRPVVYTMFLGYDEVAHHSGTERPETLAELEKIDHDFARLELATKDAPRPYEIVVLSDHGQTQGATFKQRYGASLDQLVKSLTSSSTTSAGQGEEAWGYANAMTTELRQSKGILGGVSKLADTKDGETKLGGKRDETGHKKAESDDAEIAVLPSGGLGSISFTKQPGRVSLETINRLYPKLVKTLVAHDGIGFVLIRSDKQGDLAIGKNGTHFLKTGKVEGQDPLLPFGPNAAAHVKRTSSFPHCPDIVINSSFWEELGEVAAFEELVGSHGAMGGPQQYPFILYPGSLKTPATEIVGAENVHKQFRKWLADLGWESYAGKFKPAR